MRTGKLAISRGHGGREPSAPAPRLAIVSRGEPTAPHLVSPEYQPLHDRLTALERLARLHQQNVLTDEEFAAEKALILDRHPDGAAHWPDTSCLPGTTGHCGAVSTRSMVDPVLNEPLLVAESPRSPSLLGRLLSWKFIPVGIAAGLALSFAAQPQQTMRFFDEALRLFGA